MGTGRIAAQVFAAALGAVGLLLRAIGAAMASDGTEQHVNHVRTSAGVEPAATDEDGQLIGAHSGSPAIEIVTRE